MMCSTALQWHLLLSLALAPCIFGSSSHRLPTRLSERSFRIDQQKGQFLKDGQQFRYISGEIHYFRIHPSLWNDRLERVRALGLNAVQVYVPWNFHELLPGIFDFASEGRNLTRFLKLAQRYDLHVLLRTGPYVCAEWEYGGFPWWLTRLTKTTLRSSDEKYLNEVKRYYSALLPLLKPLLYRNGGPILMLQIENEYGTIGICDKVYLRWLRDLFWEQLGNETLLYTTDVKSAKAIECGRVEGVYTTVDFGAEKSKADVERNFALQRNYTSGGPPVNSEFYTMWFQMWGQADPCPQDVDAIIRNLQWMWELGASFSLYVVHGGTNFGFWAGSEGLLGPVITSYDYSAPISEAGQITPLYLAIRDWIAKLPDWPNPPAELVPKNHTAIAMHGVQVARVGSLISIANQTVDQRYCRSSEKPLPFERLDRTYNFVWYQTVLPATTHANSTLGIEGVHDYAYVFLGELYQGNLTVTGEPYPGKTLLTLDGAKAGQKLNILVENHGRQTFPSKKDPKGILSNVTLDGHPLLKWLQCGLQVDLLRETALQLYKQASNEASSDTQLPALTGPSIYAVSFVTQLNLSELHTFFDSRPWTRGMLIINGFNLGRYWPERGPQMTLYVPGGVFYPVEGKENDIILMELGGWNASQLASIDFVAEPIYHYKTSRPNGACTAALARASYFQQLQETIVRAVGWLISGCLINQDVCPVGRLISGPFDQRDFRTTKGL